MRLLIHEHVTGGGMQGEAPPASLRHEADLMVRALLSELAELPVEILATRDPRLPPLEGVATLLPQPGETPSALYHRGLSQADAAWPTAPESGGVLEQLARATLAHSRTLIGCRPEAIALAASKSATAIHLAGHGVPVVPTYRQVDRIPPVPGPWVVKPDDGAGAEGVRQCPDWRAARAAMAALPPGTVAQPWLAGTPLSLSLLVAPGGVDLLAVNRQEVVVEQGRVRLRAIQVNALPDAEGHFRQLGERIAAAVPGLSGYVGVDLLATTAGPVVVEINPRLTTSYCALHAAIGVNVAAQVLGLPAPGARSGESRSLTLDLEAARGR